MVALITNFYKDLFCSCAGNRYDELLSQVEPRVTPLMNQILMKEFTDDEIKAALDSMGDLKAPGPDGMPALFYKKYWDTLSHRSCIQLPQYWDTVGKEGGGCSERGWIHEEECEMVVENAWKLTMPMCTEY